MQQVKTTQGKSKTQPDRLYFENRAWSKFQFVAGIDEAGRGAWAGPVVASAVILDREQIIEGVRDSKCLSPKKREKLFDEIKAKALSYGIGIIEPAIIDEVNILEATKLAMKSAIEQLSPVPDHLLIDGNMGLDLPLSQEAIIDGDDLSVSIGAASILAKVTRDRLMVEYGDAFPGYGFERHKGYGTKIHRVAIEEQGCSIIHRRSYRPVAEAIRRHSH